MIEFSDDLSHKLQGKEAITQKIITRLKHKTTDIPYYSRGVDVYEFQLGSQLAAIKLGLKDFGANVTYDETNSRVQAYGVTINVLDYLEVD
jgi:hypothetical protein